MLIFEYIFIMEQFSLEENDYSDMFITQEVSDIKDNNCESDGEMDKFFGLNADDFASPMVSIIDDKKNAPHYSDISDDDGTFEVDSKE